MAVALGEAHSPARIQSTRSNPALGDDDVSRFAEEVSAAVKRMRKKALRWPLERLEEEAAAAANGLST